jgi:beta-glucanase (GH16 family)
MMGKIRLFQILFSFLLFGSFGFAQVDVVYSDLVWSDEFDVDGAVDSDNWFHQTQIPSSGSWYNDEEQHYTDLDTNSYVEDGTLSIVGKKESYTDQGVTKEYTSARLNSKFAFTYGRVDVRAKLPIQSGTWPAIWLLGKNVNEDGGYFDADYGTTSWPACGEIDVMEHGLTSSQPTNYVQSALHTPSSYGSTVNYGGVEADTDIDTNYHIYSLNWSPNQISFLLDDVVYYTYNPTVKDDSTWPFDKEQYLLLNVAMGGLAGTIASDFVEDSMVIDYVRVYQNTTVDTSWPTDFTATVGTVTGSSVELLLNATDDSGTVMYNVDYGSETSSTTSSSGVQTSLVIYGLSSDTSYEFSVTATDATGNVSIDSPIVLNATTTSSATECSGTDDEASQGTFSSGYSYSFETSGTDVTVTFELLDTDKTGVVAYLWEESPFSETSMTNVSGNVFSSTLTDQTLGSTISYAVKFAYSGGLSVTKYVSYVVGSSCSLGVASLSELTQTFYPNPVEDILYMELLEDENRIILWDLLGRKIIDKIVPSSYSLDMSSFKSGIYLLHVENSDGVQNVKISKK